MSVYFITGVAGFLGCNLAESLLKDGHIVKGCDNLSGGDIENVPKGCDFSIADCTDFNKMKSLLKGVDIVINCAALAHEGLSVFSPSTISMSNFQAATTVFSAAISCEVKKIVHCSSMARYGQQAVPFKEPMSTMPVDPYGVAKVASERMLSTLAETHNIEYSIAVPHNIIGKKQKYDDPFRNVASIMANLVLQGRQVFIYGDGEQRRCFSHVEDCIKTLKDICISDKANGQIFNIGPDSSFITINELAKFIYKECNFEFNPNYLEERPREVKLATCSSDKAREILGYKELKSWQDGVRDIINHIRKNGTKPFQYHIDLEINNDQTPSSWRNRLF